MEVVGSASTVSLPSITLSDASDPTSFFEDTSFLVSSSSFFDLRPHWGQTRIPSALGFMRGRVSHCGQKRKYYATPVLFFERGLD